VRSVSQIFDSSLRSNSFVVCARLFLRMDSCDETLLEFEKSILQNRRKAAERHVTVHVADREKAKKRMMEASVGDFNEDWRTAKAHEELMNRFRPSRDEKLDAISSMRNSTSKSTPISENRDKFRPFDENLVRREHEERRQKTHKHEKEYGRTSRVKYHISTPFYAQDERDIASQPKSGITSRRELLVARKTADFEEAHRKFASAINFDDFTAAKINMDSKLANINKIVE